MDRTSFTNLAKIWQFSEERAMERQSAELREARERAEREGMPQGSAAQAEFLRLMILATASTSIIAIGTGSVVEAVQMIEALDGRGQLTAVDSSGQGVGLIRSLFHELADATQTSLRAVNAPAGMFLPRLNANDYDLIVVGGDHRSYHAAFDQAMRLLRGHGIIIFTDVMALGTPQQNGGVLNPADRGDKAVAMRELLEDVQTDERFDSALIPCGTGTLIAVRR
ncbi:MAG: methyltransferase [Bifidobacterium sp.]|jgi:predicted O-methyltransferase YrrM|nr:methyltransferase [Bifidobacterium sp.]MCI1865579.1 methyltransferase [Bifidobacterium sp.]